MSTSGRYDALEVKELLRRASESDAYGLFEGSYRALVVAALRETLDEERARIQRLVGRLPEARLREAVALPEVDVLLDLDPPLETYTDFQTEGLTSGDVAKKLSEVRHHREERPLKAARALVDVLGFIRNKQVHGYKRVFEDRDHEILEAAGGVAVCLATASLELLES